MFSPRRTSNRIALGLVFALLSTACAPTDTTTSETSSTAVQTATSAPAAPETTTVSRQRADAYPGLGVGLSDDGHPRLGDPDAAVTLVEYSDYLCPFCRRHFDETMPRLIEEYGSQGSVNFVFRDFPLENLHPNAPAGHAAALCVAEQDVRSFWDFHDELFENQEAWEILGDTGRYLEGVAEQVGADLDLYRSCLDSGRTVRAVERSVAEGRDLGFSGTPSFQIVNNRTGETFELVGAQPIGTFTSALDAVLTGGAPPTTAPPPPPELPYWLSGEGLAPDPERPGFTLAGDAFKGDAGAQLVVIEVSDFQCPFCQRHTLETQPALDESYVETGKIQWVFKNLPLPRHPQATDAAVAAECAGDQNMFWPMHDLLFETVERWAVDSPRPVLAELAGQLELDPEAFATCLESRSALERVLADSNALSGVISSTPTFIVLDGDRVAVIEGAQPLENFVEFFDQVLGGD